MGRRYRFRQVDVFTDRPLHGNPLAVFLDADGLSDDEMQALAREMNISETAFVLPPTPAGLDDGADYRIRIFTPGRELPFAGHPAVGTAWVLAEEGRFDLVAPRTSIRQEVAIGVLPLFVDVSGEGDERRVGEVTMTQGSPEVSYVLEPDEVAELCEALEVATDAIGWPVDRKSSRSRRQRGVEPAVISTGLPHLVIPFVDREVMADVDHERREYVAELCQAYDCDSAALVAPGNSGTIRDADVSVRIFDSNSFRIEADPATGAAAGPIAVFLGGLMQTRDQTYRVVIEQGVEVGRPSRLVAEVDFGSDEQPREARVAGMVVPVIEGWVTLP
ncbi:MAG: trans-2,3-dihydro-3-hydroxyanthranilate isomerase [Chloroflexota bacterium]|jgi:trans-2,3-dihydro-3-hydroxyanthranilate isomerase|nr:trans-2,3-dihydro-3-hydroxyanthranilate isomerase [Chloroflexota bacterium]